MTVQAVADGLTWPKSTYASYEDKYKKPFLPVELVTGLVPIFEPKGIKPEEIWALAGIGRAPKPQSDKQSSGKVRGPEIAVDTSQELLTETAINIYQYPRDVPILGSGACGEDGLFELNGQIHGYAKRTPRLNGVRDAYAVYIQGVSMFPWRKPGQLAFVDPYQPPKNEEFVVVQLKAIGPDGHKQAYIKQLIRMNAKEIRLHQFNPAEDLTIPMSKVFSVHKVIDWDELLGL